MISSTALSAKWIRIHPTICGSDINNIDFFRPIVVEKYPNTIVPKNPPIVKIDPINDASSFVIVPLFKGDNGDFKSGIAALVQPAANPYDKPKRFTQKVA